MVKINLLPWRSEQKKKEVKALTSQAIVCSIAMLCLLIIIHFAHSLKIDAQVKRNNRLQDENTSVSSRVNRLREASKHREVVIENIKTLQTLQHNRFETITLFNELARVVPKGVYLNRMERFERNILIDGESNANALISQLIKRIDNSNDFTDPVLKEVHTQKVDDVNTTTFTISFSLKPAFEETNINRLTGATRK